jgi:hypothetical protein
MGIIEDLYHDGLITPLEKMPSVMIRDRLG